MAIAVLAAPLHAVRSLGKPSEATMTITLSQPFKASRSDMFAAFAVQNANPSLPEGVIMTVLSERDPQSYRATMPGGDVLDMTITDVVDGHSLTIETVISGPKHGSRDFSRTLECFEIVEQHNSLALNFVMVLVLNRSMARLTRSYSELLMTQMQKIRLDKLIFIAETLSGKTSR